MVMPKRLPDICVAITAHSETVVAGPTIASAEAAIALAEAEGLTVERIVGLDKPTAECTEFFSQPCFDTWRTVEMDEGDLGGARNRLANEARSPMIAFLDADDLFSENWLVVGQRLLQEAIDLNERIILHPEVNIFFDAHISVLKSIRDSDPNFFPYYYFCRNYFDSLVMAPRDAFLEVPYKKREKVYGFGYEDWRWNIDTFAKGWRHEVATDTVIFKRRQDSSMVIELGQKRSVLWPSEELLIDNVRQWADASDAAGKSS
jgi:hypothetical protein